MCYVLLDLAVIDQRAFDDYYSRTDQIIRMIGGLAAYLRRDGADGPKSTHNPEH